MAEFSRIAKNAKLGDGCIPKKPESYNAHFSFVSTDLELLKFKKRLCENEGITTGEFGTQKSGYGGTKTIYKFSSRVHEGITDVAKAPIEELLRSIDKEDLFLWYMDDGSWHKNQRLCHLYCNMLDDYQLEILIDRIAELYGIKPKARKDRKKDGRSFNYLYFPRKLVLKFRPEFKEYVMNIGLESMYYKFGGVEYEDHLESLKEFSHTPTFDSLVKSYATAKRSGNDIHFEIKLDTVKMSWNSPKGNFTEKQFNFKEAI